MSVFAACRAGVADRFRVTAGSASRVPAPQVAHAREGKWAGPEALPTESETQ